MNQKTQKQLRKSTEVLVSLPDVKSQRRTPTKQELKVKHRLSIRDGTPEMKLTDE